MFLKGGKGLLTACSTYGSCVMAPMSRQKSTLHRDKFEYSGPTVTLALGLTIFTDTK